MSHSTSVIKNLTATAAVIEAFRIVKFDGTTKTSVLKAAAATDAPIGVSDGVDIAASGRVDVVLSGLTKVTAGAAFNPGAYLTSDSAGRAVAAAPAAGTNNGIVGIAVEEATALGDIVEILVNPQSRQG
jgi:NH3-dependent NAD+ synthetase